MKDNFKYLLVLILAARVFSTSAQDHDISILKDQKTGCKVLLRHAFSEDSIVWSGPCVEGYAEGKGKMTGFTKGKQTSSYVGYMKRGMFHGQGSYVFGGDRNWREFFRKVSRFF